MLVAIDFETANSNPASACAVGVVQFDCNQLLSRWQSLIRPHSACGAFSYFNIGVHGITPRMVANAPEWSEIWPKLTELIAGNTLIAHNASFDISVLLRVLELYQLPIPDFDFFCTCKSARRVWPELTNHRLNTISEFLDWKFKHHDALEDAAAAANALRAMLRVTGVADVPELADRLGIMVGQVRDGQLSPCKVRPCRRKKS